MTCRSAKDFYCKEKVPVFLLKKGFYQTRTIIHKQLLFRQLKLLDMDLIQRSYFNPKKKIEVRAHKMEVWPGINASILQYEKDVMLCADVQHKVLRRQSVLDIMYEIHSSCRDPNKFYDIAAKKLIGETVMTR